MLAHPTIWFPSIVSCICCIGKTRPAGMLSTEVDDDDDGGREEDDSPG